MHFFVRFYTVLSFLYTVLSFVYTVLSFVYLQMYKELRTAAGGKEKMHFFGFLDAARQSVRQVPDSSSLLSLQVLEGP